jgi:CheY-like chemotaxis protein
MRQVPQVTRLRRSVETRCLTDVMMPGMRGDELTQQLRAEILGLTAFTSAGSVRY